MNAKNKEFTPIGMQCLDDENPNYMFGLTNGKILAAAIRGEIDLLQLAKNELHANRGHNADMQWIGFKNGAKLANEKLIVKN